MVGFRGIRYSAGCVGAALLIVGFPLASLAQAGPPKAILHSGSEKQAGDGPYWIKGSTVGRKYCDVLHADGFYNWPKPLRHAPDDKLRLRFHKDSKPDELSIRDYPRINRHDGPAGDSRRVRYELKRVRNEKNETIGWKAIIYRRSSGHHYLDVLARWQGKHECRFEEAAYNFHVKTTE